jgi:hypothetical protein
MSNLILRAAFGLAAVLAIASGSVAQEATKPAEKAPLVPDPSWRPKAGDTASVYSKGLESVPCATEYLYYPEFDKLLRAKDNEGFEEMIAKGQVLFVKNGTPVRILEVHENQFLAKHAVLEVRFQDGQAKGRKGFIDRVWVARLIERPAERKAGPKASQPATTKPELDPAEKAKREGVRKLDTLMRTAKALEKSNIKGAIENYREVVKDFPDTPEAKAAAERIKALTK